MLLFRWTALLCTALCTARITRPRTVPGPQMTLCLYVGNAIKDLVSSPRPLGVAYGREKLKFLGASDEEVELNAKVLGRDGLDS